MTDSSSPVLISKRLVLINSASGIMTRVLTVGVFAWVIQYLMKRIPEAELELLPITLTVALVVPILQTILAGGLARHVTEAYAKDDQEGITRIVSSQFPLLLAGAMLILLVGGAVAWNIHHILFVATPFVDKARLMTFLVVLRMAIGMVIVPFNTGLFANQRFVLQNVIEIAGSLLRIVLMVALVLGVGPQVEWVIVAQVASQIFTQGTQAIMSMRLLPALRYRPGMFDWNTCKRVLSFGSWSFVTESASIIRRAADAPILNLLSTPVAVNDFFLGSTFETQLRELATRACQPLLPALTAMHALQQPARLASAYLRGGRIALWASMFLAVPLMIFSHDLFALYLGAKYPEHVNAAWVMVILLLGFPLTYPAMILFSIAQARGDIRPIALRALFIQMGNLALTLLLVGKFEMGAIGSAAATWASFAVGHPLFFWRLALNTLDISWRRFWFETLLPGLIPAVVSTCAGLITAQLVASTIPRVVVGIPVCLLTYGIAMLLSLRPADRNDLARLRRFIPF